MRTSNEYSIFNILESNRQQDEGNIRMLMQRIENKNLTHLFPIIIDEDYNIIDGQHRFTACKRLGLPIHYVQEHGLTHEDIIEINTVGKKWSLDDYLRCYVKQGKKDYIKFERMMIQMKGLTISKGIKMAKFGNDKNFKNGNLEISNNEINRCLKVYELSRAFVDIYKGYENNSFLLRSLEKMVRYNVKWDNDRLVRLCMSRKSDILSLPSNEAKIIKKFEEIYNHKLRNKVTFEVESC